MNYFRRRCRSLAIISSIALVFSIVALVKLARQPVVSDPGDTFRYAVISAAVVILPYILTWLVFSQREVKSLRVTRIGALRSITVLAGSVLFSLLAVISVRNVFVGSDAAYGLEPVIVLAPLLLVIQLALVVAFAAGLPYSAFKGFVSTELRMAVDQSRPIVLTIAAASVIVMLGAETWQVSHEVPWATVVLLWTGCIILAIRYELGRRETSAQDLRAYDAFVPAIVAVGGIVAFAFLGSLIVPSQVSWTWISGPPPQLDGSQLSLDQAQTYYFERTCWSEFDWSGCGLSDKYAGVLLKISMELSAIGVVATSMSRMSARNQSTDS